MGTQLYDKDFKMNFYYNKLYQEVNRTWENIQQGDYQGFSVLIVGKQDASYSIQFINLN